MAQRSKGSRSGAAGAQLHQLAVGALVPLLHTEIGHVAARGGSITGTPAAFSEQVPQAGRVHQAGRVPLAGRVLARACRQASGGLLTGCQLACGHTGAAAQLAPSPWHRCVQTRCTNQRGPPVGKRVGAGCAMAMMSSLCWLGVCQSSCSMPPVGCMLCVCALSVACCWEGWGPACLMPKITSCMCVCVCVPASADWGSAGHPAACGMRAGQLTTRPLCGGQRVSGTRLGHS